MLLIVNLVGHLCRRKAYFMLVNFRCDIILLVAFRFIEITQTLFCDYVIIFQFTTTNLYNKVHVRILPTEHVHVFYL